MPPKGERRKQQIINTAKVMFIEKGFQSTHIGQVCDQLNIARGTVYQYFSNKKEILFAILDTVLEDVEDILDTDDLKEFVNNLPGKREIEYFVSRRISDVMRVLIEEPIVIKLIFKEIVGIDDEVIERVNAAVMSVCRLITREIEEIKSRGIFRPDIDSAITASMLVGGIMLIMYEYDKKKQNVLEQNVIDSIAHNYLNSVYM